MSLLPRPGKHSSPRSFKKRLCHSKQLLPNSITFMGVGQTLFSSYRQQMYFKSFEHPFWFSSSDLWKILTSPWWDSQLTFLFQHQKVFYFGIYKNYCDKSCWVSVPFHFLLDPVPNLIGPALNLPSYNRNLVHLRKESGLSFSGG